MVVPSQLCLKFGSNKKQMRRLKKENSARSRRKSKNQDRKLKGKYLQKVYNKANKKQICQNMSPYLWHCNTNLSQIDDIYTKKRFSKPPLTHKLKKKIQYPWSRKTKRNFYFELTQCCIKMCSFQSVWLFGP